MTGAASLQVRPLEPDREAQWDAFVFAQAEGTFFHRLGWRRVIERAFHHPCHYLGVWAGEELRGVLPLVHQRSRLFGNALISIPFGVYGGILARDQAAWQALEEAGKALAHRLAVDHLELRHRQTPLPPGWQGRDLYYTFRQPMKADQEANLQAIPRKQRAEVRRGLQAGLTGMVTADPERCYALYAESVRNLGTPVFPKALFTTLQEVFGADCQGLVITHQGRDVNGVLSFYFRDEVLPFYGGGVAAARGLGAHPFMYWTLMGHALARGARVFDFGRSKKGTGSFDFKKNFGFTPSLLPYAYHLVRAERMPEYNPLNPKYRLFIALWQRLPLGLTRVVGPWLSRGLG
ncbi:MAG: FemAB family PEP-CTERM system-associated protein [Magnetococcales bacterium]|nr:FemAB family PEP-CTERM system-associated protein [Magnetococcales bacterium]